METLDFSDLYTLQDRILDIIFSQETGFYLTGGTCLHRFYYELRNSADLDLFSNDNNEFREDIRIMLDTLEASSITYDKQVDTRDFVRLIIDNKLQVDMVNDRVYRYGRRIKTAKGIFLDNIENIGANKICAILGRDDPKDIFDIYTIYTQASIDWGIVIEAAKKKCFIDPEIFEYRLKSFPMNLIDNLSIPNIEYILDIKQNYSNMANNLLYYLE